MTEIEANKIIIELKKGKTLGKKFKDDEWGVKYLSENVYEKWNIIIDSFINDKKEKDLCRNYKTTEISENTLKDILCKYYSYDEIIMKLY